MKGTHRPIPDIYSAELKGLVASCTKLDPNMRPSTQAMMGILFLQGPLLNTQFSVGRLNLSDDPVFL